MWKCICGEDNLPSEKYCYKCGLQQVKDNGAIYGVIENVIEFPKDFDYNSYYSEEQNKLKPLMEKAGFKKVSFADGERDSFGPLSRVIYGVKYNRLYVFVYG